MHLNEFEPLFKSHFGRLCSIANKIVRDRDVAKDIVQEVFLKIWNQHSTTPYTSPDSYLRKATINASINYLESRKRIVPLIAPITAAQIDSSDKITEKELEYQIQLAIDKLPPQRKVIFVLSRFEDMKYQQIADHLDISVKTVENQMGKALRELREELKPYLTREFITATIAIGISMLLPYLAIVLIFRLIL